MFISRSDMQTAYDLRKKQYKSVPRKFLKKTPFKYSEAMLWNVPADVRRPHPFMPLKMV
jgi:hypothetical protein